MTKEIDNRQDIEKLFNFEDELDFYAIQIIRRRKDGNDDMESGQSTIRSYYISNVEYLDKKWDEIVGLCEYFKARAYIDVNKKNYKDVLPYMNIYLGKILLDGQFHAIKDAFHKGCGKMKKKLEKRWIIDVDTTDTKTLSMIRTLPKLCKPWVTTGENPEYMVLYTPNGFHIITKAFNLLQFQDFINQHELQDIVEIKKDNPTILFAPKFPKSKKE